MNSSETCHSEMAATKRRIAEDAVKMRAHLLIPPVTTPPPATYL
jgi:hypothetical protein